MQDEVARDLEEEIAEEGNPDERPELLTRDRQVLVHRERGETDVDPVKEGDHVEQEEERNEALADLRGRLAIERGHLGRQN